MRTPHSLIRARFVDGPLAGVTRLLVPGPDGSAPPVATVPVTDPGLGVSAVVYERVDSPVDDTPARYRVAPVPLAETR